ncbi:MAG: fibronectin type III-like domain-contianing protein, partial [Saprospiraceae bacterium]|nr:fibronectin type III-like domain-contianing protein [Saprospiraceae bacterium]
LTLTVQNTGEQAGKEVVQIYASKLNSTIDRPVQELKAFAKTDILQPGETTELSFYIQATDLQYWDEQQNGWQLEKGNYSIKAGNSSRDIHLSQDITL